MLTTQDEWQLHKWHNKWLANCSRWIRGISLQNVHCHSSGIVLANSQIHLGQIHPAASLLELWYELVQWGACLWCHHLDFLSGLLELLNHHLQFQNGVIWVMLCKTTVLGPGEEIHKQNLRNMVSQHDNSWAFRQAWSFSHQDMSGNVGSDLTKLSVWPEV